MDVSDHVMRLEHKFRVMNKAGYVGAFLFIFRSFDPSLFLLVKKAIVIRSMAP